MINHTDALALMAIEKQAEGGGRWLPNSQHPHLELIFGVLDSDGARIRGLQIELRAWFGSGKQPNRYALGLFQNLPPYPIERVYFLEIGQPPFVRHRNKDGTWINGSHERTNGITVPCEVGIIEGSFETLLLYFCKKSNLTLHNPIVNPETLELE